MPGNNNTQAGSILDLSHNTRISITLSALVFIITNIAVAAVCVYEFKNSVNQPAQAIERQAKVIERQEQAIEKMASEHSKALDDLNKRIVELRSKQDIMDTNLSWLIRDYKKTAGILTAWLDIKESAKAPDFNFSLETEVRAMDSPKEQEK